MTSGDDFIDLDLDDLDLGPGLDDGPDLDDPFLTDDDPAPVADPVLPIGYFGEDPAEAAEHWHVQEASHSCAVVSQEFILDDITGVDHSEAELCALAEENGWYVPGQGTSLENIGNVLEAYGVPTEQVDGASIGDLAPHWRTAGTSSSGSTRATSGRPGSIQTTRSISTPASPARRGTTPSR